MTHEEIEGAIERLRSMKTANRDFIVDVCRAFLGDCEVTGDELHYTLIELLEQADPDTHMELPKDGYGEVIHIGDRMVEHEDGHDFVVDGYEYDGKWWVFHIDGIRAPAYMCTHYHKPTVEDVLRHVISGVVKYANEHRDKEAISAYIDDAAAAYAEKIREVMADE